MEKHKIILPRKLIEVALPLDAINAESAREKSIRHGHPSTLHLWWARRPLASARAVIFAQMVNDPGDPLILGKNGENEKVQAERQRLFEIIEKLVKWENTNNQEVLREARGEILKSWHKICLLNKKHPQAKILFNPDKLPAFHDPFAGGGALPFEAQRLGLESYASDLNPVAVMINKAMIEIPPKFINLPSVFPLTNNNKGQTKIESINQYGIYGLAEDVRHYGLWMHEQAIGQIGDLYPPIIIDDTMIDNQPKLLLIKDKPLPVVAWLWARTVKSPDPRYAHLHTPLVSNFILSKTAYVKPVVTKDSFHFEVKYEVPPAEAENGTKLGRGANFRCLFSNETITGAYIKTEGMAGKIRHRLMAIVADGGIGYGRLYFSPIEEHENIATSVEPNITLNGQLPKNPRDTRIYNYGIKEWSDVFTNRQLVGLNTFSDLVQKAIAKCQQDAITAGMEDDGIGLEEGGTGATAYGQAVGVYLTFAVSRATDRNNSLCRWETSKTQVINLFSRQSIAMLWDFAENNILGKTAGSFTTSLNNLLKVFNNFPLINHGLSIQANAQNEITHPVFPKNNKIISTDPPYYDNIAYADISDFFYVWLRKNLKAVYPSLFVTMQTPKNEEMVALSYRHESKEAAADFFMNGMKATMCSLSEQTHPAFPITIYYAFKQAQTQDGKTYSTGWAVFLEALLDAGFSITGTWPMRTERANRQVGMGNNALASSIVLVCKKRLDNSGTITRQAFIQRLNEQLPNALIKMQAGEIHSSIAPVDLSQAMIGPGMEIFSRYTAILDAQGKKMSVKEALSLINRYVGNDNFDATTRFCLSWFETYNWAPIQYGEAETLAMAKNANIDTMRGTTVLTASAGKAQLCRPQQYPPPQKGANISSWQGLHYLTAALDKDGYGAAGRILVDLSIEAREVKDLAYRLYAICERKKWNEDARPYNSVITNWDNIQDEASKEHATRISTAGELV